MNVKQTVLEDWQKRMKRARKTLAKLEAELAYQNYELEITRRLQAKAQSEADWDDWRVQIDILSMLAGQTEERMEEEQEDIALCTAMIAEIEADLAVG
ncbi:MAG: hypothetical protein JXA33_17475 [Anaerolineae bacterium]|nr:hypothetical protein [Anaerolineae bacterium]